MTSPPGAGGDERRDLSAKELADDYGLHVAFWPRWRGWILSAFVLAALAAAVGLSFTEPIDGETAGAAVAGVAAIAAVVFNAFESRRAMVGG